VHQRVEHQDVWRLNLIIRYLLEIQLGFSLEDVLKYIIDEEIILKLPLPWGTGNSRYVITNESPPLHPNGKPFFYPITFEGYTMESHYSRDRAMNILSDLAEKLELSFEIIET
jgi:hypothetical protein